MKLFGMAEQGCPIKKLRFHPRRRLLASVAGTRAEVGVWTWDDSGAMECLARITREADSPPALEKDILRAADLNRERRQHLQSLGLFPKDSPRAADPSGSARPAPTPPGWERMKPLVNDVAWHPRKDLLALAAGGRAIELWEGGRLVGTIGKRPVPGRVRECPTGIGRPGQAFVPFKFAMDIPLAQQGYDALAFSASGDRLVASLHGEDPLGNDPSEVYDVATGGLVDSFWRSDTTLALHPEGEILAAFSSDQLATAIRFGRLTDTFQTYDVELTAFADGYARLLFNTTGDTFAIVGHAYGFGVKLYRFPSCQLIFEADYEAGKDNWNACWRRHRENEPDRGGSDAEEPPHEFILTLPRFFDRLAFSPDGRRFLAGGSHGAIVEINMRTGEPSGARKISEGPVTALDASPAFPLLASADYDGGIRLWQFAAPRAAVDLATKPMTRAFLEAHRPIDPDDPGARFRITDGKKWYNLETIGEDELDDDAPPWAQIAKMTSLWRLDDEALDERAETDRWARRIKAIKQDAARGGDADRSSEAANDAAPE